MEIYVIIALVVIGFVFFIAWRGNNKKVAPPTVDTTPFEREIQRLKGEINSYQFQIQTLNNSLNQRIDLDEDYLRDKKKEVDDFISEYLKEKKEEVERLIKIEEERAIEEHEEKMEHYTMEYCVAEESLEYLRSQISAINEAIRRQKEIEEKEDFYRIVIDKDSIEDIESLERVIPILHNRTILQKLIYETFIRRPVDEMIKRVLGGNNKVSGIYKITFLKTGEAYIGKSTDVARRWREHCKTALGIGTIATSTLHIKMGKEGMQNFSFELLEEVDKGKLTEKEKAYIDIYQTDTQLNMKKG